MPHLDLTRDDHAYFFGFFQTDGHLRAGTVGMRARPVTMRPWTDAEDAIVRTSTVREAARLINRTERAVNTRRWRLRNGQG